MNSPRFVELAPSAEVDDEVATRGSFHDSPLSATSNPGLTDIFSRYAVGWMVADRENSALAARLIEQTCHKQGVQPQVLTLHSDRGAPMTSKCTAQLLADLGVTRSLSRPQVSDDNPFSEAQFKTLKYHPGFPGRFHDLTGHHLLPIVLPRTTPSIATQGSPCSPPMMSIIIEPTACWNRSPSPLDPSVRPP